MSGFDLAHALQVASRVAWPSTAGWLTGLLHDAIEDGGVTGDDLHEAMVPPDVVTAVEDLTRREGETYVDYIGRVAENPLARAVKLADIDANLARMDFAHSSLRGRYENAYAQLTAAEAEARSNANQQ